MDEVQRLLLANLPGVGTDLILQAVKKLYDWQYKRVREKLVELVKATIDYSLVSYKISQGDKFPSASGVWVAPQNYHLVSYEVIVDEESITVFTDLVLIDLTLTFLADSLVATASDFAPIGEFPEQFYRVIRVPMGCYNAYESLQLLDWEWYTVGASRYERYAGNEFYYPVTISPKMASYCLKGLVNPPGVKYWSYLEPPWNGTVVAMGGGYIVRPMLTNPSEEVLNSVGSAVLAGEGNKVFPGLDPERYYNQIESFYYGRTYVNAQTLHFRVRPRVVRVAFIPVDGGTPPPGFPPPPIFVPGILSHAAVVGVSAPKRGVAFPFLLALGGSPLSLGGSPLSLGGV